jgi:uncharacterized XkdX family phage protein
MEHSPKFELIKSYYDKGLWTAERVLNMVIKGWITQDEYNEIIGDE